jgi:hypothetical protein
MSHLWITADFLQSLRNLFFTKAVSRNIFNLENASLRHLLLVHRCTVNVFKEFQRFCDPNALPGHQHLGVKTEVIKAKLPEGKDMVKNMG